jgi:hypothetical protein
MDGIHAQRKLHNLVQARLILLTSIEVILLTACQPAVVLAEPEAREFADQVEAIVENSLQGLNEGDYARHARDFDDELKDQINEISFPQVRDEILGRVGQYETRKLNWVEDQGGIRTVIYDTVFERDDHVTLRVVFFPNDPEHQIGGMWFDSPAFLGTIENSR